MNRRSFLRALGVAATAAAIDPEQLLWEPGKKTFFLPPAPSVATDAEMGISIRYVKDFALQEGQMVSRIDVLYGLSVVNPQYAVRVMDEYETAYERAVRHYTKQWENYKRRMEPPFRGPLAPVINVSLDEFQRIYSMPEQSNREVTVERILP